MKFLRKATVSLSSQLLAGCVLLLLTTGYWLPLLASSAEHALPACCRTKGTHRCAVKGMASPEDGSGVSVVAPKCPMYPAPASSPQGHAAVGIPANLAHFCEVVSHPAIHAQVEAHYRVSFDRTRQKRGPPSLNLS